MFFIDKIIKLNKRDTTVLHVGPAILVFGAFFTITVWNWLQLRQSVTQNRQTLLEKNIGSTRDMINKRFSSYEDVLNASAGLFDASDYVSHKEWGRFIEIFDLSQRYPGMKSIGFIQTASNDTLSGLSAQVRSKENRSFKVYPSSHNPWHAPIIYSEPLETARDSTIGYDTYTNPQMKAAMERARDSGRPAITEMLSGIKNSPFTDNPQVIVYSPIYLKNSPNGDLNSRRKNIMGYTYSDILTYRFMEEFYDSQNPNYAFRVYDSTQAAGPMIYQSPNFNTVDSDSSKQTQVTKLQIDNRQWTIVGVVNPGIISSRDRERPANALWGGVIFSTFLAMFIYMLLLNRTRALSDKEEQQIQSAKDELLALASHQLRTPATGVKQYIGMLREGYGGKLSREQKKYLDSAYESNERQLGIINDMLFVARSDNGEIEFNFEKTDLVAFIKEILKEQEAIMKVKQHKLVPKLPEVPLKADIDRHYLRMALENLLSNSTKYTREGGKITLTLKKVRSQAVISVEDTGVGVEKKYFPMLFKKFSRVPNALSSQVSGSGIGLYLAKKVVDAHRGRITFDSAVQEGTTCTMTFPLKRRVLKPKIRRKV